MRVRNISKKVKCYMKRHRKHIGKNGSGSLPIVLVLLMDRYNQKFIGDAQNRTEVPEAAQVARYAACFRFSK